MNRVGIQTYPLSLIFRREGKELAEHLDDAFSLVARCGIEAIEPNLPTSEVHAHELCMLSKKHNLDMPSAYANVRLHTSGWRQEVERTLQQLEWVKPLHVQVLTVNPEPIDWNSPENKSDEQLATQAVALQSLGEAVSRLGIKLGYHVHSPEMRAGARELHHMMLNSNSRHVGMCLDAHWIFRGAENSQLALFDIMKLYGDRIVELHARQSIGGVWSETLCDGDIDYSQVAARLKASQFEGPIIIEQCFEQGTPFTMPVDQALRANRE